MSGTGRGYGADPSLTDPVVAPEQTEVDDLRGTQQDSWDDIRAFIVDLAAP